MEFIATIVFIVFAFGLQLYKEAKVHLAVKERSRLLSLGASYMANEYVEMKAKKPRPVPPNVWGTRFTKIIRNGKRK